MKRKYYLWVPACLSLSVAVADPSQKEGSMLFTENEMDGVTAGLYSGVTVDAFGQGPIYSVANTNAVTFTTVSNTSHPALGGYLEVAGGGAVAGAAGQGATTDTSISPVTSSAGLPGTYTIQAGGHFKSPLININANVVYTTGSLFINPF